ncbi:MAG: HAD hydrolase-like protein [Bryobacteraceae bacterium]|nr:HAD hydrolase-like protein [Bryobacteraceae bacterium]
MTKCHLTIDADDTLWENNVYFERAFDGFCNYLNHSSLTPDEVRERLDEIEIGNIQRHGYGAENFARGLRDCFCALAERKVAPADLEYVTALALGVREHPLELIEGVAETLAELSDRHELVMFTKGDVAEQRAKIERSGLERFFDHAAIVREKDVAAYEALHRERGFRAGHAWMIGNSPKSDINPSLAAGWNAAFVPHERTWTLERTELVNPGPGRLLVLERFPDLLRHF